MNNTKIPQQEMKPGMKRDSGIPYIAKRDKLKIGFTKLMRDVGFILMMSRELGIRQVLVILAINDITMNERRFTLHHKYDVRRIAENTKFRTNDVKKVLSGLAEKNIITFDADMDFTYNLETETWNISGNQYYTEENESVDILENIDTCETSSTKVAQPSNTTYTEGERDIQNNKKNCQIIKDDDALLQALTTL